MKTVALKLTLEYDGTRYHGWQSQKNSRTVQDALIEAARAVLASDVEVGGAGRTDAGVHALGQVAHLRFRIPNTRFKNKGRIPLSKFDAFPNPPHRSASPGERRSKSGIDEPQVDPDDLRAELNRALPADISISRIEHSPVNFHARHDALRRYYLYQIASRKTAFSKRFVWWVKESLDLKRMERAAEMMVGRHDFAAFGDTRGEKKSTLVEMYECSLLCTNEILLIRLGASHFLWKMVRRLVGSMVEIGRGSLALEEFREMLQHRKHSAAEWTAPASGLFLEKVSYSDDDAPGELKPVLWA